MKAIAGLLKKTLTVAVALSAMTATAYAKKIRVLYVDGQNNHNWAAMTPFMKAQMEKTGMFKVDVVTSPPRAPRPPKNLSPDQKDKAAKAAEEIRKKFQAKWDAFRPAFKKYDVVVSNYNGEDWPKPVQTAFEKYMEKGGRFIVVHAANNSFPNWLEYNKMIGLGGWGGRTEKNGPYVYYDDAGKVVRNTQPGRGGSHGPQLAFKVVLRNTEHPVTKGMPKEWLHAQDELYDSLRGPAENMEILATSYSDKSKRHEPMMMTIKYGKGFIFHTPMGHENGKSVQCVGFIATLNRAAEWLATGKVSQALPKNFPTASQVSLAK